MNETTPPIMTINDELLAELEAAANAATGSWYTVDSAYRFPVHSADKSYVAKSNPSTILALLQHVRELKADAERLDYLEAAYGGYTGHDGGFHVSLYLPDKDSLREMVDCAMENKGDQL